MYQLYFEDTITDEEGTHQMSVEFGVDDNGDPTGNYRATIDKTQVVELAENKGAWAEISGQSTGLASQIGDKIANYVE